MIEFLGSPPGLLLMFAFFVFVISSFYIARRRIGQAYDFSELIKCYLVPFYVPYFILYKDKQEQRIFCNKFEHVWNLSAIAEMICVLTFFGLCLWALGSE